MKEPYIFKSPGFEAVAIRFDQIEEGLTFMKEKGIKSLAINSAWGWKNKKPISFLKDHPWIEGVSLVEDDLEISVINELHKLKVLLLSGDKYKGELDFGNFPDLRVFRGKWDVKRYARLNRCIECQEININKFPWENFEEIRSLNKLEKIELNYGRLQNLNGIENYKMLKDLNIYSQPELLSLTGLQSLSECLEILAIQKCKNIREYDQIGELKGLKALLLSESSPIGSVGFIHDMRNLERVYLGLEILDKDPSPLKERGFEFKRSKNYK